MEITRKTIIITRYETLDELKSLPDGHPLMWGDNSCKKVADGLLTKHWLFSWEQLEEEGFDIELPDNIIDGKEIYENEY